MADKFNVSRVTANRAFIELEREGLIYRVRGSGSFVASDTDKKVQQNKEGNNLIALILPFNSSQGRMMDTIKGATEYLNKFGYYLSVHSAEQDSGKARKLINELVDKNISGIIYYPNFNNENLNLMNKLFLDNYPIVTIDKYYESIPISYVVSDNFEGGYKATQYLIELNHRNIGFMSEDPIEEVMSIRERYFGYCKALKEKNIELNFDIIKLGISEMFNEKDREKMIAKALAEMMKHKLTAVVTGNDYFAIQLMDICESKNIPVPEEISIIGFDNIEQADKLNVPLTTVEQNFHEIGRKSSEILVKSLEKDNYDYEQIMLPVKLIKRKSTINRKSEERVNVKHG